MNRRLTINDFLALARCGLDRLTPVQVVEAMRMGALIVDTRQHIDRVRDGVIAGSLWIPSTVLLWACDPESGRANEWIPSFDAHLIVMCNEGFSSSVAAHNLQRIGFPNATDMIGGHDAWRSAGLASQPPANVDGSMLDGRCPPEPCLEACAGSELPGNY